MRKEGLQERLEDLGLLAKGGMAAVHRVRDEALRRLVAMKRLDPAIATKAEEVERFREEAQVTAQLDHPHITPVHELGVDAEGQHFFTMRLVEGRTLEHILSNPKYDPADPALLARTLQTFLTVCDAVSFAHSRGVIHCDLKPANVMVGPWSQIHVMDWGIARLPIDRGLTPEGRTVTVAREKKRVEPKGRVLGTIGYMAPEQARGKHDEIDERTDVFALGAILYRAVVGQPIYGTGGSQDELLARAMFAEIDPPERVAGNRPLPKQLLAIARKALSVKKEDRHESVEALHDEVEAWLLGDGRHPTRTVKAGEAIVRQGDPGDCAFIITRGRCVVWKDVNGRRQTLREMGPGEVFGETAIFASKRRTATVEAVEETTVIEVSRASLEEDLGRTWMMGDVVRALAYRFQDLDARAARLRDSAEDGALERAVLAHFAFHGGPAEAEGERVAPWAPLRDAWARTHEVGAEQATAALSAYPGLRIEAGADRVFLSEILDEVIEEVPPPPPPPEA